MTPHGHHLGVAQRHVRHLGVDQPAVGGHLDDLGVPLARIQIKPQVVEQPAIVAANQVEPPVKALFPVVPQHVL